MASAKTSTSIAWIVLPLAVPLPEILALLSVPFGIWLLSVPPWIGSPATTIVWAFVIAPTIGTTIVAALMMFSKNWTYKRIPLQVGIIMLGTIALAIHWLIGAAIWKYLGWDGNGF